MHRIRMLRIATALILVALGGGCPAADTDTSGSDAGPEGADPKHSSSDDDGVEVMAAATVSSAGGEVKTQDGSLAVRVPSGALDQNVKVTVESTTAPAPGSVGTVFEIGPTGTQFKQPVTIALKYTDQDLSDLRVATYGNGAWQVLPNYVVDTEHHTISGDTMHLSPYALVRIASGQTCGTRSVGCSGATAPRADTGTGGSGGYSGSGSSTGGAGASAIDAGAAEFDAGVKADAPPPPPPPPEPVDASVPPEKQEAFAPPSADGGTGGGTAADGGTGDLADAGVRSPDEPAKLPAEPTCDVKPTCDSAPACSGIPGAARMACHDTETGFEETCCFLAVTGTDDPKAGVRDAGVDVGSTGGAGSSAADAGTATAPDASVPLNPDAPKPEVGGTGGDTGGGGTGGSGTAGTSSADAGVPQPPKG